MEEIARANFALIRARQTEETGEMVDGVGVPDRTSGLQNLALALEIIFPVLSLVVYLLRMYIRIDTKNLGWDDAWMTAAMVLAIAQTPGCVLYIKYAYVGIDFDDVPPRDPYQMHLWGFITGAIYQPILALVKMSILVFLLRLGKTKRAVQIGIWIQMALNISSSVAIFFAYTFACEPHKHKWEPAFLGGHCPAKTRFALFASAWTLFTDLLVLATPFFIFGDLRMVRRTKIAIIGVFLLGFIVTVVGAVRFYFLYSNNVSHIEPNVSYSLGYTTSAIETNLGIITGSAPALWPLARRWFPSMFTRLALSRGYQGHLSDIEEARDRASPNSMERFKETSKKSGSRSLRQKFFGRSKGSYNGEPSSPPMPAVHATCTIGGSPMSFALSTLSRERASKSTEICCRPRNDSEEEMIGLDGVTLTKTISVIQEQNSIKSAGKKAQAPRSL